MYGSTTVVAFPSLLGGLGPAKESPPTGMHPRERLRDDMQYNHATMQKWEMIISYICQANITSRTRVKRATAQCSGIEDACVAEARLSGDEDVEEPGCVGEVGTYERVWRTEDVEDVEED